MTPQKRYQLNHPDRIKKYCQEHKKETNARAARYRARHPERVRAIFLKWHHKELRTNPDYKLRCQLRQNLRNAFRQRGIYKTIRASKYGVDYRAIIQHLGPIPSDGKKYNIDHIKPLALFDLTDPTQVKAAFAPENLQWLTAEENRAKSDTYGS